MALNRREWNALVVGGLVVGPLVGRAAAADSTVAGVRIGAQSYSFRDRSLDEAIAAMQAVGIGFCELWQNHIETAEALGHPDAASRRDVLRRWRLAEPLSTFHAVRDKFVRAGIVLTAYNISFRDDFSDAEITRGFEMAQALGVNVITASSNVATARRVDPFAKRFKIRVGVHNHSAIRPNEIAGPDDFAQALKGLSDMMAINLDIGHFTAANLDALAYLGQHHDRIVSVHLKDRKRDQGPDVPFGEGDTPIKAVLALLRDKAWPIPAHIEYEYAGADTVEEVRRSFAYCKQALVAPSARAQGAAGWRMLFDGTSLDGWAGYKDTPVPAGWRVIDGTLAKDAPVADIVSKEDFGDFELEMDWKIGEAGNSGIFYRGTAEYDHIYWSAPEYQLLDDIQGEDNKTRLTCAGAAYALYPSPAGHLKPVGEWNQARIVVKGAHVEHWLNGVKLVDYELWSPDWEAKVKDSKFGTWPNFGRATRGRIAMQGDHAGRLAFRNIRIREIRAVAQR